MIERKIGATNYNTKGTLMKIVDIRNDLVTVEFQDKHKYRMTTIFTNFKTGCIKNPYDKTIVGVGIDFCLCCALDSVEGARQLVFVECDLHGSSLINMTNNIRE